MRHGKTWDMQQETDKLNLPALATKKTGNPDNILLWGVAAHSGMGCTWHGCRTSGNNIYEGRNEWGNIFISIHVSIDSKSLLWGVHLSIDFFNMFCLLVDMIDNITIHIYSGISKKCFHERCWFWRSPKKHVPTPLLATTWHTPYITLIYSTL